MNKCSDMGKQVCQEQINSYARRVNSFFDNRLNYLLLIPGLGILSWNIYRIYKFYKTVRVNKKEILKM